MFSAGLSGSRLTSREGDIILAILSRAGSNSEQTEPSEEPIMTTTETTFVSSSFSCKLEALQSM